MERFLLAGVLVASGFVGGYASAKVRYEQDPDPSKVTLTLGDYVPGKTPCAEDEVFDTVRVTCIHIDQIAN